MNIRLNEDYYYWCCEWCDTENRVLWARVNDGVACGACHKKLVLGETSPPMSLIISAGLC
jgi:hypothetical protein